MTLLHQLYTDGGQSPWIDNLTRTPSGAGGWPTWSTRGSGGSPRTRRSSKRR